MKYSLLYLEHAPFPVIVGWIPDDEMPVMQDHISTAKEICSGNLSVQNGYIVSVRCSLADLVYPMFFPVEGGDITLIASYEDAIAAHRGVTIERLRGKRKRANDK